jgi:hypothetical protein
MSQQILNGLAMPSINNIIEVISEEVFNTFATKHPKTSIRVYVKLLLYFFNVFLKLAIDPYEYEDTIFSRYGLLQPDYMAPYNRRLSSPYLPWIILDILTEMVICNVGTSGKQNYQCNGCKYCVKNLKKP